LNLNQALPPIILQYPALLAPTRTQVQMHVMRVLAGGLLQAKELQPLVIAQVSAMLQTYVQDFAVI
jgi:hypothetical protein